MASSLNTTQKCLRLHWVLHGNLNPFPLKKMFPNPHTHFCTNALCLTQSQSCQDHIWREKDQNSGCIKTSLPSLLNLYRTTTEMPCPVIALSAIKGEPPWSASLPWLLKWIVLLNKLPKQRLNLLIIRRKLHPSFYKDSLLGGSRSVLTLPRPWKGNMLHMRCSGAQVPQPDCPCLAGDRCEKSSHISVHQPCSLAVYTWH